MRSLLFTLTLVLCASTAAQGIRVGAVVSQSGSAARTGQAHANSLRLMAGRLRASRGVYGVPVEIIVRDDGSLPSQARREVEALIEAGVHVIVCCSSDAASLAVIDTVQTAGVPTLTLSSATELHTPARERYWLFGVVPDATTLLRSALLDIAAQGGQSVALLAADDTAERVQEGLERHAGLGGLPLVADERYPAGSPTLTPEALWVASRQPGGVLVYGDSRDSSTAILALRARGYEGDIYIDPDLTLRLTPLRSLPFNDTLTVTNPFEIVSDDLETRAFINAYNAVYGRGSATLEAAYAWDAMLLVQAALEQALSYGLDVANLGVMRQVIRDTLVSAPPVTGATARFDYQEDDHLGIDPRSLPLARVSAGRLVPAR